MIINILYLVAFCIYYIDGISGDETFNSTELATLYLPQETVKFYCYNKHDQLNFTEIKFENLQSLRDLSLNSKQLKILVHGWKASSYDEFNIEVRDVFLRNFDVNVIIIDWSDGMYIHKADAMAFHTGKYLAKFIDWLIETVMIPPSNIHLIGHSLGAQLIGVAGKYSKNKVVYITALDPPGGSWERSPHGLNREDATYVEVIHTFIAGVMLIHPAGHVDIYPNGGQRMPGCEDQEFWCSHRRAYKYFAESLVNPSCAAQECYSYEELLNRHCSNLTEIQVGGVNPKNRTGVFYLETNARSPYCKKAY